MKTSEVLLIVLFLAVFLSRLPLIGVNQAVWWDEAQYLLVAKHNILGTPTTGWWEGRSFFYPDMLTLTMFGGFSEWGPRLLMLLMVAGLSVFTYLLFKELFGKRWIAFFTALATGFQWVIIFYSFRILRDIPAAFFVILSNYLFIKSFNSKKYYIPILSGAFLAIGFLIRSTHGLVGVIYLIYTMISYKFKPKNYAWIIGALIVFGLMSIPDTIRYGNPLHTTLTEAIYHLNAKGGPQAAGPAYYLLTLPVNYGWTVTIFMAIGLFFMFFKLKKNKLFVLLTVFLYLFSYSFLTEIKEFRFLIHITPFLIFAAFYGVHYLVRMFKIKDSFVFLAIVASLILIENVPYGYGRVFESATSYAELKIAGEALKSLSINGTIMSNSVPQLTYYSDLPVINFPGNKSDFVKSLLSNNVKFVVVSIHEKYPDYAYHLNYTFLRPLFGIPKTQPVLVTYYFNSSLL